MAQRLGALAVLEWELGLVPSTHTTVHYSLALKIVGSDALFWPPWAPGMHVVPVTRYRQNTHAHNQLF